MGNHIVNARGGCANEVGIEGYAAAGVQLPQRGGIDRNIGSGGRHPIFTKRAAMTVNRSAIRVLRFSRYQFETSRLRPATGAKTTRLGRTLQRRSSACRRFAHGPREPALRRRLRAQRCRVHRTPPRVQCREAPLLGDGIAGVVGVICGKREADYFAGGRFVICAVAQISAGGPSTLLLLLMSICLFLGWIAQIYDAPECEQSLRIGLIINSLLRFLDSITQRKVV